MRSLIASAAVLLVNSFSLPASAHHSFAAEFDGNKPVRLSGTLTKIEWQNPHVHFYLDVRDSKGEIHNWMCESGNPGALSRTGWEKGSIKFGDQLIVDGYLAKDGSRFIDAQRITLPDGRSLVNGPESGGPPGGSATDAKGQGAAQ